MSFPFNLTVQTDLGAVELDRRELHIFLNTCLQSCISATLCDGSYGSEVTYFSILAWL